MVENGLQEVFTAPAEIHSFTGILFDMDGTIVDSTQAISKHWVGYFPSDNTSKVNHLMGSQTCTQSFRLLRKEMLTLDFA